MLLTAGTTPLDRHTDTAVVPEPLTPGPTSSSGSVTGSARNALVGALLDESSAGSNPASSKSIRLPPCGEGLTAPTRPSVRTGVRVTLTDQYPTTRYGSEAQAPRRGGFLLRR